MINVVANLGTARDKASHTSYSVDALQSSALLAAYRSSWLAAAIIDYPAEDATRTWRRWQADEEQIKAIEKLESEIGLKGKVKEALITARLYGGAAIYINTDDSDQAAPLAKGTVIKSLIVLSKNALHPKEIITDIYSKYYNKAEIYTLQSSGAPVDIHASRLAIFNGSVAPYDGMATAQNVWGDSVLQSCMDAIKSVDSSVANTASLVFEAKVDVFRFKGFADMLSNTANDELITRRLMTQAAMKSINGAIVIDMEDDYQQKAASFSGLTDVISKLQENASGAARIPLTRLYGRSAAGLSGSGDGDERVYYDRISSEQESVRESLSLLDYCLVIQALGEYQEGIYYEWNPLRQVSKSERATLFSQVAAGARTLAGNGVGELVPIDALSDALVNELNELGILPGLSQSIDEYGSLSEQGIPVNAAGGNDEV